MTGGLNTYAYVGGNPINNIDPWGLATYVINRGFGSTNTTPTSSNLSHTFVAVTNMDGIVTDTFSWGNSVGDDGKLSWTHNAPNDLQAAQNALSQNIFLLIGSSILDPYVIEAFNELNNGPSEYWDFWDNCKHKTSDLLDKATQNLLNNVPI